MNLKNIKIEAISEHHLQPTENSDDKHPKIKKMTEEQLFSPADFDQLKIIYAGTKDHKTLNEYRELRTKLLKKSQNKNFVCMVSSLNVGAEATHVAINLAASIALDSNRTALIIDCNIYGLGLSNYLQVTTKQGLTNFLAQDSDDIEQIIYHSGIPRIRIIPVGLKTEYAAEYFSSEKMTRFIEEIKQRYPDRFIILNTSPIELYAESQILTSLCDLSVLVIPYGQANKVQVQTAIDIMGSDKLAGLIFYK